MTLIMVPIIVLVLVVVAVVARLGVAVVRFVRLDGRAARRNWFRARRARLRWRRLAANLSLSYMDRHRKAVRRPVPFGSTAVKVDPGQLPVQRFPRAKFTADAYGIQAAVKCVPKVGREEFEGVAPYIADAWGCHRVQVSQKRPGRLTVRGLVTDPLAVPFGPEGVPAGVYDHPDPGRPYLGLDEWGQHRYLRLANISGMVVGGLPGRGKTSFMSSLLWQWSGSPAVQMAIADGKGGADYEDWAQRSWLYCPDDLGAAVSLLEDCNAEMRRRMRTVQAVTGSRNGWHRGPTLDFPLLVVILDECQHFLDLGAVKGRKQEEDQVRRCQSLSAELVRKGRAFLVILVALTQKPTTDSIPSSLRDNAGCSVAFGVKTVEAAAATLGADIREYPGYSPVGLQDPEHVGVCTTTLRTGFDPFTRVRVPEISEASAAERARATAHLRSDDPSLVTGLVPRAPRVPVSVP